MFLMYIHKACDVVPLPTGVHSSQQILAIFVSAGVCQSVTCSLRVVCLRPFFFDGKCPVMVFQVALVGSHATPRT